MKYIFSVVVLVSIAASGCYYDIEEELYPNGSCTTSNVTYATTISGMMNNYGCVGCHGGTTPSGGIRLETYEEVKARAVDGSLWGAVNHERGFVPMPQGSGKMSTCDLNKLKAWITAGTPN